MGIRHQIWLGVIVWSVLTLTSVACHADPSTAELAQTTISLQRTVCYGTCPAYKVTIRGDGHVHFESGTVPSGGADSAHRFTPFQSVLLSGIHDDQVPVASVAALAQQFRDAGFFKLKDRYQAEVTDNPSQIVTLTVGTQQKSVIDYVGTEAGMPVAVRRLEEAIDHVAGTERWVLGTVELVPWLERAGFDFHSPEATELAVVGEETEASEALVAALIDRGIPLGVAVDNHLRFAPAHKARELAGVALTRAAVRRGHAGVFTRMVARGWLARWGKVPASQAFAESAAGCSPSLVDAVADAGVAIDAATPPADKRELYEPGNLTALSALRDSYSCGDESMRVKTAEKLLNRGADPNHRNSLGQTPLYGVENLQLLNLLLTRGGNAKAKANNGESLVFGTWTDAIVLRLLEAGASPEGKYSDGRTLAQQAKIHDMPQVESWLIRHGERKKIVP